MNTRLSIFRTCLVAIIVVPQLVLQSTGAAVVTETREVKVSYGELDLSTGSASAVLYSRLSRAANEACSELDGSGQKFRIFVTCKREALDRAVSDVNRDSVTALHQRFAR